ncbi:MULTISPECIES: DUF1823 family protein [unclassified Synechococcus]|nr:MULTISPECIES: DUF1823 family protein [unclassified Synechococcus]WFN60002.1 DUF1823 family protein [Synechococcus sp. CCFWC 502]
MSASSASQPEGAADPQPLSRALLMMILDDRLSDRFVCELIWRRLGYELQGELIWRAGPTTPAAWAEAFPQAPELIAERPASVRLTRSIPAEHKQLLKAQLGFAGYRISELVPRRTRRATAVSWLLADQAARGEVLPEQGPLPEPLVPPESPLQGHPGDPAVH